MLKLFYYQDGRMDDHYFSGGEEDLARHMGDLLSRKHKRVTLCLVSREGLVVIKRW